MTKKPASGHTRKHTGTKKHKRTAKHHPAHHKAGATAHAAKVHTVAKHPHHAKARGLALADGVQCCAAQALAASARIAGGRVDDDEVLALHEATACCHGAGASILATLEAAAQLGLGRFRLARFTEEMPDDPLLPFGQLLGCAEDADPGEAGNRLSEGLVHGLILGVELPGAHAVLATPGGWWSWGELYDSATWPEAVIEEAWAVSWA